MTREEFAQQLKQQYPQYKDVDDDELVELTLSKYPIYRGQVTEPTFFQKATDFLFSNTKKFGETLGTAASVMDPETNRLRDEALETRQSAINETLQLAQNEQRPETKRKLLQAAENIAKQEGIDIFNNPEYQKTTKQILGEAGGTLMEGLAFSSLGKAPGTVKKLTTAGKIGRGALEGAGIGAAFGGGFAATEAMQEDKSLGGILQDTVYGVGLGGAGGAVLGGAFSAAGAGTSALAGKVSRLRPVLQKRIGDAAYNKLLQVSRDFLKMSPTVSRNEAKWNKNTPKFLVDEGIIPLLDSDGSKLSTRAATEALKLKYKAENAAFEMLLKDSGQYVSLNTLEKQALKATEKLKSRGSDYTKARKHIVDEISTYKDNYGDVGIIDGEDFLIPIDKFNEIKSGLWSRTSNFNPTMDDKLLSDLNYIMGHEAKQIIEDSVEDVAIKRFNSRLGDFASAMKVLQNAEGKTIPGGFFGRQFTKIAGSIAGSGSGIPGVVIGNLTGGALADLTTNPKFKIGVINKLVNSLNKTERGRSIIDEAVQILEKRNEQRAARKLLEAPNIIYAGPGEKSSSILTNDEATKLLEEMNVIPKASGGTKNVPLETPKPTSQVSAKLFALREELQRLRTAAQKLKGKALKDNQKAQKAIEDEVAKLN